MTDTRRTFFVAILSSAAAIITASGDDTHHPKQQHEVMAPAETVPGESIYQLQTDLTDQNGKATTLAALRGRPTLVTMFYTSCQSICPVITVALQRMEAELSAGQRDRLRIVMISLDPTRDTPEALAKFARAHEIDSTRWLLARASPDDVQDIAAVLGIRYRQLPDGSFSHSAVITLLDSDGVVRARTENLQQLDPAFLTALREQSSPPR